MLPGDEMARSVGVVQPTILIRWPATVATVLLAINSRARAGLNEGFIVGRGPCPT
jgi:hypothetical protein